MNPAKRIAIYVTGTLGAIIAAAGIAAPDEFWLEILGLLPSLQDIASEVAALSIVADESISFLSLLGLLLVLLGAALFLSGLALYGIGLLERKRKSYATWMTFVGLALLVIMGCVWWFLRPSPPEPVPFPFHLSFPAHVQVLTPSGVISIKDIRVADAVITYDLETKTLGNATVLKVFVREDTQFVELNRMLKVTPEHPLAVLSSNLSIFWKRARDIQSGDCLVSSNAECVRIDTVQYVTESAQTVYNMHVSGPENYFVFLYGVPVLAHNKQLI